MNNNTAIAFLALFGLTAAVAVAVAVVVTVHGTGNQSAQSNQPAQSGGQPVYGVALEPQTPLAAPVLYENEERWELRRGPDRLIEEIIIHRTVTQNA